MVQLKGRDDAAWMMDPHTGSVKRTTPLPARFEVETCARCHARRGLFDDRYVHGRPLMDTHRPALLEEGLYYADGQIQGEVYEYGSFLAEQDVPCWRHLQRLPRPPQPPAPGRRQRALRPLSLARTVRHTGAPLPPHWLAGSQCVACHMPAKTYMGVDVRRDHSFRRYAAGSVGAARDAQRVQRLSHRAFAAVGG